MTQTPRPPKRQTIRSALALALLAGALARASADAPQPPLAVVAAGNGQGGTGGGMAIAGKRADEIRGTLDFGSRLTERGDYDGSEIAFRQILNAPDASPTALKAALLGLAHMHRRKGELTKAVAIYEKYLKEYPGDDAAPDALLELGRSLREMGAYNTAIVRFYSVINSTLKLPVGGFTHYQQLAKTAQFEIAETHFEAGEYAEACKFFSRLRLLDLAPADRAHAHFMAAYSLYLQGSMDATVTMLDTFLEQWPDDDNVPEARYMLATSLRKLKRPQDAFVATLALLRAEKTRVASNPKRWSYWQRRTGNQLANDFFEDGDIVNAQAIYAGLASLSNDPAWLLPVTYQLGLCYERLGSPERAHAAYKAIVDGVKDDAAANFIELKKLAAWRIDELDWHENISHQVTDLMVTRTGHLAPAPAPKKAPDPTP